MSNPIMPGVDVTLKGVYMYRCPTCRKTERFDDRYGPTCTGPHPSLDEHPMVPMELVGTERSTLGRGFHAVPSGLITPYADNQGV